MTMVAQQPLIRIEALYGDRLVPCYADRPRNLSDMLAAVAADRPAAPAIVDGARQWDYLTLDTETNRIANALAASGIAAGERVALFLGNSIEFVALLFGIWRLGAIAVPIGTRQSAAELEYILNQCSASALCFDAELAGRLPACATIPTVKLHVCVDGSPTTVPHVTLKDLVASADAAKRDCPVEGSAPACIMYTSGTTGKPKGAVLSHLGFLHTAQNYERIFGYRPDDRMLLTIPGSHISGLLAVVVVMMRIGGCIVSLRGFKAAEVLEIIETQRITAAVMVPAMYNLCLLEPDIARRDLSSWRIGHFGGAAMPEITIQRLAEVLPNLELYNGFGATETTSAVTLTERGDAARYPDSVGTLLPCVDIRVLDEAGREVPRGETGELWIRSPGNAIGYWDNPQATRASFVAGYWRSGDIGALDSQGYLRVLDRIKDMINRGGFKVYCVELENVIQRFEGVIEAAAVAAPCPVLGERIHVFLHATGAIDVEALRAFCAEQLADYKTPDYVTVSATPLPRNLNGKLVKAPLREVARQAADSILKSEGKR